MPSRLARLACALLFVGTQGSCLVTSVDEFPEPASTPPFLNGSRATPPLNQVILVDPATSSPITFSAFVRSEDAGQNLDARLVYDWPQLDAIQLTEVGAGTFNEDRLVSFTWDPRSPTLRGDTIPPGCHPFTMIISHRFNPYSNVPARLDDSDFLVWWVFIADRDNPDSLQSFDLLSCPDPRLLGASP
jgi:hypothetical protein